MSGGNQFQEKATRLFNRLNAVGQPAKIVKNRIDNVSPSASSHELMKVKEEIEASDFENRKKMRILSENLKKLEGTLKDQNQNRAKMNEVFSQSVIKLEKQMKSVISSVQKSFIERQKKLDEKIDSLIKSQRKEIETKIHQNEDLIEEMNRIQSKALAIAEEIAELRRNRLQLQERITKQFNDQLRELKRIFENDVRQREQKQGKSMTTLKNLYKGAMQRIYSEQKQRQQSEIMLMAVVQQLVAHIIDA